MKPALKKFFMQDFVPLMWVFNVGFFLRAVFDNALRGILPLVLLNLVFLVWSVANLPGSLARRDRQRDLERLKGSDAE